MRYAEPQDLPGFPSHGLANESNAASAAALHGWANRSAQEPWRPSAVSPAASSAALLADSNKAASAASRDAAAAAAAVGSQPSESARAPSLGARGSIRQQPSVQELEGSAPDRNKNSPLLAAQKAAFAGRPRSKSSPASKPSQNPTGHATPPTPRESALSAATLAHSPRKFEYGAPGAVGDAGAVPITTMGAAMFTSNPPVKPEVDEQRHREALHASAVALAKPWFLEQQRVINQTRKSHGQAPEKSAAANASEQSANATSPTYPNLHDIASHRAQERIAKHEAELAASPQGLEQSYRRAATGSPWQAQAGQPHRSWTARLTRRRSSSDGDVAAARGIYEQMRHLSTKMSDVDRQRHEAIMAAAQRNARAKVDDIDRRVAEETGMVPPGTRADWERRAYDAAAARARESTRSTNGPASGPAADNKTVPEAAASKPAAGIGTEKDANAKDSHMVDIGGGLFMPREKVEAMAAKRSQVLMDDINEKAARAREEMRLQQEQKAQEREEKERNKQLKGTYKFSTAPR